MESAAHAWDMAFYAIPFRAGHRVITRAGVLSRILADEGALGIQIVSGRPPSPSCIQGRRDQDGIAISQPTPLAEHAPFPTLGQLNLRGMVTPVSDFPDLRCPSFQSGHRLTKPTASDVALISALPLAGRRAQRYP